MERESFDDEQVAALLNSRFVCVKVDREERPDIDQIYMEAVQMMSGQGGWPLNVWLTPDLVPVYGGTYFPPEPHPGRPSFPVVVTRLHEMWTTERERLLGRAEHVRAAMIEDLTPHLDPADPTLPQLADAARNAVRNKDSVHGGFGTAPKFPMAMALRFLWREGSQRNHVRLSLNRMCRGGLFDHVGGGFHRYSTDNRWLVPHFEKMLYDQALLISLLADVISETPDPLLLNALELTGSFLEQEMLTADGFYGSALDADSNGIEGAYYTWSPTELTGRRLETFVNLSPSGNWEGRTILELTGDSPLPADIRKELAQSRRQEWKPAFDPKPLASWNALTLIAFCDAFLSTTEEVWMARASRLGASVLTLVGDDGSVRHQADSSTPGFATDHALVCLSLCRLYELTTDYSLLYRAIQIGNRMIGSFLDTGTGTAYFAEPSADRIVRRKDWFDHAEPSANSASMAAFHRLGRLTSEPAFVRIAADMSRRLHSLYVEHSLSLGFSLQTALESVSRRSEVILCGDTDHRLLRTLGRHPDPHRLVILGETHGKTSIDGNPTAWVCRDFSCKRPVHTPEALVETVKDVSSNL